MPFGRLPAGIIPVAILFTWLNNKTGGSLFLAAPEGTPRLPLLLNWLLAAVVLRYTEAARLKRRAAPVTSAIA